MPVILNNTLDGFGPLEPSNFIVNGQRLTTDVAGAVIGGTVMRTAQGASTITLQLADPLRTILRSGLFVYGSVLQVENLSFTAVQLTKSADVLQLVFEASGVAALRLQTGVQATTNSVDLTGFVQSLVSAVPGLQLIAQSTPLAAAVSIGRGTSNDVTEDSWTCIQRVVTSAGWRCFEVNGIIWLGPDSFFLSAPSQGTLVEFTPQIQNIDFDYDIGKPFGTATVTGMCETWGYPPGAVVWTSGMGPMDGQPWMVQDCQRDLYSPQMTATLHVPMSPYDVINGVPTEAPF